MIESAAAPRHGCTRHRHCATEPFCARAGGCCNLLVFVIRCLGPMLASATATATTTTTVTAPGGTILASLTTTGSSRRRPKIGILGSTRGTNCLHIYAEIAAGRLHAEVAAVVSNIGDALILERARAAGVKTVTHIPSKGKKRVDFDAEVNAALEAAGVELVLLVGFMRILSPVFVKRWKGRCLNVHPSLLPKHAGLMDLAAHEAVLAAGDGESGCTVHLVDEVVDAGAVIVQPRCQVAADETAATLKAKVQALEVSLGAAVSFCRTIYRPFQLWSGPCLGKLVRPSLDALKPDRLKVLPSGPGIAHGRAAFCTAGVFLRGSAT